MKLVVVLVLITLVTPLKAQTCSVGGSSSACTLCPSGKGTVSGPTFGADIALTCTAPTGVNVATSPTASCPLTLGGPGTSLSLVPGILAPASFSIASGASTGTHYIGATSPTPSQILWYGQYSTQVNLGIGGVPTTLDAQSINLGNRAKTANLHRVGETLNIQIQRATRDPTTPTPTPYSQAIRLGWSTGYAPSPSIYEAAGQDVYISEYSSNTYIATGTPAPTPTNGAGPVSVGWRTPSPVPTGAGNTGYQFNTVSLNGKYHEFYSGHCTRTPTSFPTSNAVICETAYLSTNGPTTASPSTSTSGYSGGNGRYYPITTGVYISCFTANLVTAGQYIQTKYYDGSTNQVLLYMFVQNNAASTGGCFINYVATVGTTYFWIDAIGAGISAGTDYLTFSVARIG